MFHPQINQNEAKIVTHYSIIFDHSYQEKEMRVTSPTSMEVLITCIQHIGHSLQITRYDDEASSLIMLGKPFNLKFNKINANDVVKHICLI